MFERKGDEVLSFPSDNRSEEKHEFGGWSKASIIAAEEGNEWTNPDLNPEQSFN